MTIPVLFVCAAVAYLWWTASPAGQPAAYTPGRIEFPAATLPPPPAPKAPPSPTSEREQLASMRRRLAADELLNDDLRQAFDTIAAALPAEAK
jgi:hypothetical protein